MNLAQLNTLTVDEARQCFMQCCTSSAWVDAMVRARPFADQQAIMVTADSIWHNLTKADYLQAFAGHPQIGNLDSLHAKYANTKVLASGEQSAVKQATAEVIAALAQSNADYLAKFGFIFIVCATGKSAAQMLALLQARLPNKPATELTNAAEEQRKIFHLRLEKLL
ncbi:MAG: 2-oxo-4-hydroxy-4-carboxy-5-ureidoimidazoline decarboxylase [Cognaticolwellia sp.]